MPSSLIRDGLLDLPDRCICLTADRRIPRSASCSLDPSIDRVGVDLLLWIAGMFPLSTFIGYVGFEDALNSIVQINGNSFN